MAQLRQVARNPIRAAILGLEIRAALDRAIELDPDNVDARLDRVRFSMHAPAIAGGGLQRANDDARAIAQRDEHLGAFARGYILYRDKQYGGARIELQRAIASPRQETRVLALTWLGWLSQETQQYDTAFATFERLRRDDPDNRSVDYEIGRTTVFCDCSPDAGIAALRRYIANPDPAGASRAEAHFHLGRLLHRSGDLAGARREFDRAWMLDSSVVGLKEARRRASP